MLTICACGAYDVEQASTAYRKGEKPMCHEQTCAKVKEYRARGLRRTPFADDIEHDLERVG